MAFTELGCMTEIHRAVDEMGWLLPTDIQAESIPLILGGGDVLMAAETGSGKTGAFSIPVVQIIHEAKIAKGGKIPSAASGGGDGPSGSGSNPTGIVELSAFDRDADLALMNNLAQSRHFKNWNGCRANYGVRGNEGRYSYEVTCTDQGLSRLGFSSSLDAKLNLGTCPNGFGFGGTGKKSNNYNFEDYGEAYGQHDVMGVCIDLNKGEIKYFKNGKDLGVCYRNLNTVDQTWFPAIVLKNAEVEMNFDNMKHKYPGYKSFSTCLNLIAGKGVGKSDKKKNFDALKKLPMSIIIEPSRELAQQTASNIEMFSKYVPNISYVTLVGGVNATEQMRKINEGVDIIIATPGRLDDFLQNGNVSCDNIRFLVMDEADAIIKDQGNLRFIHKLHSLCPNSHPVDGKRLQVIVCSATLHNFDVKKLAEKIMKFPTWVDLKGQDSVPDTVHHIICHVKPKYDRSWEDKQGYWTDGVHKQDRTAPGTNTQEQWSESVKILKARYTLKYLQFHKCDRGIIFCRTKLDCDNLEKFIQKNDKSMTCVCLHSDRKPQERKGNLEKFKQEKVKFLICTDVAARGIDVKGIPYVINVTMPDQKENYVHRIGRVGRADRMGLAVSFVSIEDNEKVWYHSNCRNRGKGCFNTSLTDVGGCCIWYNERNLLGEVEDHLGITIDTIEPDMKVPVNEFDGKVVYGEKNKRGAVSRGHVDEIAPALNELKQMEKLLQGSFLDLGYRREAKLTAWK